MSNRFPFIFVLLLVTLPLLLNCGDDGVAHSVQGEIGYWPYDEGDEIVVHEAPECTTEAFIASDDYVYSGDYHVDIRCEGWLDLLIPLPRAEAEIEAIPVDEEIDYGLLIVEWHFPGERFGGEVIDSNWSQAWDDHCSPGSDGPTWATITRHEIDGDVDNEHLTPFKGTLRFEFEGCVQTELEIELNTK
jgi:hypothetical protein